LTRHHAHLHCPVHGAGLDAAASPPACHRRRRLSGEQPKSPELLRPLLKKIPRSEAPQEPRHWSGRWGENSSGSSPPADGRHGWPPGRRTARRTGSGREGVEQPLRSYPLRCQGRRRPRSPARGGAALVWLATEVSRRPQSPAPKSEMGGPGTPLARLLQAPRARPPRCGCRAGVLGRPSRAQGKAGAEEGRPGPGRR
jgi:hypothetical protein